LGGGLQTEEQILRLRARRGHQIGPRGWAFRQSFGLSYGGDIRKMNGVL
tara:strand:- start:436 stop:582 length:147 start_codon:yes stop_codon:yes gene_type:complete